jgi:hypothetical protein
MPLDISSQVVSLTGLIEREQIRDVIVRALLAFDYGHQTLWDSAWSTVDPSSNTLTVTGRPPFVGNEAIQKAYDSIRLLDTQHSITNERIAIDTSGEKAHLICYIYGQHFRAGEGMKEGAENFLGGGVYEVDLIKEKDGSWKILQWDMTITWTQGSRAVFH